MYFGGRKAEYIVGIKSFIFDFWKDNMPEYSKVDDVLVDIIDIQ